MCSPPRETPPPHQDKTPPPVLSLCVCVCVSCVLVACLSVTLFLSCVCVTCFSLNTGTARAQPPAAHRRLHSRPHHHSRHGEHSPTARQRAYTSTHRPRLRHPCPAACVVYLSLGDPVSRSRFQREIKSQSAFALVLF